MTVSIVEKATFGKGFARLDAEYVEHESLANEARLQKSFTGSRLSDLVAPVEPDDTKVEERLEKSGCPIQYISIDAVDTADGLSFETAYGAFEDLPSRAQYLVAAEDILVSNVRPNRGAVTLIRTDQAGYVASSGFTLIRLRTGCGLASDYLFALLKTPFMRDQLVRRSRGSMYPAVVRADVLDLFIPQPTKIVNDQVGGLMKQARNLQAQFFAKKQASALMLEQLLTGIGAPPSPLESHRSGVDWTEVEANAMFRSEGAQRLDAEFFRSEYSEFELRCSTRGTSFLLGEHFDLAPGRALVGSNDSTYYAKQGILTNVGINWAALDDAEGSLAKGAWKIQQGDILLACTAHEIYYVGRKCDVVSEVPESIGSEIGCVPDLMILRPKKPMGSYLSLHYVAAFLRHPSGLHQVQRCIRGLRGGHIYKQDLERFVRIARPEEQWMRKFDFIEVEAERIRNEAKQLVAQAVSCISEMLA
jgi:hypothetical protein